MNISRESIGELNDLIKIKLEESDYAQKIEMALKEYRKKANIPGFRPGHVPMGYIVKAYGRAAKADEINKLLNDSLFQYLKENELKYLGEPMPYDMENDNIVDFENDKEFEFAFEIGRIPEINFEVNKELEVYLYKVEPEEKYVLSTIENNQKRFSRETDVDAVEENDDMIRVKLEQVDNSEQVIADGIIAEDVLIAINMIKNEELKSIFNGLKTNESLIFNPMQAFQNETEVAAILKIEKDNIEGLNASYKTTINQIFRYLPSELDIEFYKKLFGSETTVNSEEDLKTEIKKRIAEEFENETYYRFSIDAKEIISNKLNLALPDTFLKKWLIASSKENQKFDDDTFEKEYTTFAEDLKWQLISANIFKKNNLHVTEKDIHDAAEELVISDLKRYGIPAESISHDLAHQFVHSMLDKKEDRERAQRFAEHNVLSEFLKNNVTCIEKTVSIDEFNELVKSDDKE